MQYPWVEGISLAAVFALFVVELMAMRFARFGHLQGHDRDVERRPTCVESRVARGGGNITSVC